MVFRSNFDRIEAILNDKYGLSIKEAIYNENDNSKYLLKSTTVSQTAIFSVEICLLRMRESWGEKFITNITDCR